MPKLLFFTGSSAANSLNGQLAKQAEIFAQELGAETTFLDLKDYALPLYDPESEKEHGIPQAAKDLKQIFQSHDGAYLASPEYNGSFSPLLKNTIDWISRVKEADEPFLPAFTGKIYAIGSASPGALGGIRGLMQLRMLLGGINITVVPSQLALGQAHNAFDDEGRLQGDMQLSLLKASVSELVKHSAV